MNTRTALVVDDAPANRDFLERLLNGAKFNVIGASGGQKALAAVADLKELAMAVVDMKLPDMSGLQLIKELHQRFPTTLLVIATMLDERNMIEEAFRQGCHIFLVKPHGFVELFQRLMASDVKAIREGPYLIIDQYGPREYKGATSEIAKLSESRKLRVV
jgi:CheY-like chemotaxis protein